MCVKFLLDFLYLPLLLRDIELEKLNIMQNRRRSLTVLAIIIHTESGLNGIIDEIVRGEHILLIEEIPLVESFSFLPSNRIVDGLLIDEIEEIDDDIKGILAFIPE